MTDKSNMTYPLIIGGALVAELDVRVDYEGGPWGWSVDLYDYNKDEFVKAPRDWHDKVMQWAHAERQEVLDELRMDHHAGQRITEIMNAAE